MAGNLDHLGIGVFETFLLRFDAAGAVGVIGLDRHIARMLQSAQELGLPDFSVQDVRERLRESVRQYKRVAEEVCRGRLILRPSGLEVRIEPWQLNSVWADGVPVALFRAERSLPQHKSCSALISHVARTKALQRGFEEALLVDASGDVREGAWSNFFIIRNDSLVITPQHKILPGVTRAIVLEILQKLEIRVEQRSVLVPELFDPSNQLFITQATTGLTAVNKVESVTQPSRGQLLPLLQKNYSQQVLRELA